MNRVFTVALTVVFATIIMANTRLHASVITITEGSTSGYTMTDGNTYVIQNSVSFTSGIIVANNATVVLYIPQGVTLTAKGANGYQDGGCAGIRIPDASTLIITGEGAVNATGGKAGYPRNGEDGNDADTHPRVGEGGDGGRGGGGAGAAIGGNGGRGGDKNGGSGAAAETMGQLYILGTIKSVNTCGGEYSTAGSAGKHGSSHISYRNLNNRIFCEYYGGGGGGGGGGAGASPSCAIGGGGSAGGGGGRGGRGKNWTRYNDEGSYSDDEVAGTCGAGGKSKKVNGAGDSSGAAGGAYGAEGGAGTLYISSTATVDVNRTMLAAETHTAAQYTITLDLQGGCSTSSTATATLGCAMPTISAPTRMGYTFGGYYTSMNGGGTQYYSASGASARTWDRTNPTTLYAKWTANTYTLSFNANGGEHSSSIQSATVVYGEALPECIPTPIKNGGIFLGWGVCQDGSVMWYGSDGTKLLSAYSVSENTTLYAIWKPVSPSITPISGTILSGPVSVVITCTMEGATIYYTTDGTEPTAESTVYRRFRVSGRTTIKAIAVKDGLCSEIAVAEYAIGQCVNPVITPANGATFNWSGQPVSIAWEADESDSGVLRYTTDGSDPTAESPIYSGPFTIDDSTVVKAKAFGDQFFDSAIITANLTRVWVNVATPTITAASSFTGSKTKVTIACDTPGAAIRYTLVDSDPDAGATLYTAPFYVTDSCTVKAYATCYDYLDSAVATQSITKVWAIGDTVGAPDHTFATGGNLPFVRVTDNTAPLGESMKSGAITHNQTSTLSTTVMGPGTISFKWKTSCEDSGGEYDWDHAEFWVDDTRLAQLDGETVWQTVTQAISGNGSHTLLWKYVKDEVESEGEDCCWVADYHWASALTETQTTPTHVPYVWLRGYYPHTPDEYDAYESAAKEDSANGLNKVWECYVAGLNPTNAMDVFRTVISIGEGGAPVVGWDPDLNEGGTKHERVIRGVFCSAWRSMS